MTQLNDNTGAPVTIRIEHDRPIGSYTVSLAEGATVGRVDFIDSPAGDERIVFHTEVDREFGGRGLAGLLVREVLADSIRRSITVVPVCPLFADHLTRQGDEFIAMGGTFRRPRPADLALVDRAVRGDT